MSALVLRCARCQQSLTPADAEEVAEEQGSSASLVYVHRGRVCWPKYVRRHQ